MTDAPESAFHTGERPDWPARLDAYLAALRPLKERGAVREVLERELLLTFIQVNSGGISEYPMLETQQRSIVNILCRRSDHPADAMLRKLAANFPLLLNRLDKELAGADQAAAEQTAAQARNVESLLVKSVQGMVFAMGLTTDNFEELIMRHFGAPGLSQFSEIIKAHELDQGFWREFVERFIAQHVEQGYAQLTASGRFALSKDGQQVLVRFLFDDVLSTLHDSPGQIDKTRIQAAFEQASADEPARQGLRRTVQACLAKGLSFLPSEMLSEHLESATLIVCLDALSQDLAAAMQARSSGQTRPDEEAKPLSFLMEQAVAMALGAILMLSQTREHFFSALAALRSDEIEAVRALSQDLSIESLERVLFFLLESAFVRLLREKARDEGGKVTVRTALSKRTPAPAVEALAAHGMTRIRKNQIWLQDPTRPDMLLFKVRTLQQLAALSGVLQLEGPLANIVRALWERAPLRRDFLVVIDLAQVARATQNIKGRLAEILGKYGVLGQQAGGAPAVPGAAPASPENG